MDGAQVIRALTLNLITMVLSLSVHEYSHAVVADRLGDDTPRRQGRLTLSPLEHYDVFGTIIIPVFATLLGGFAMIGWARPVETVPSNFTRRLSMRTGSILVAIAGPLSNLLLAVISIAALAIFSRFDPTFGGGQGTPGALAELCKAMFLVNVGLCVFNLIPLPPLDGSRLLPQSMDEFQRVIAPWSFLIILLVLNVPALRLIFIVPVVAIGTTLQMLFGVTVGLGA